MAYCWGRNSEGELGDGTTTSRPVPVSVAGGNRFREVSTGDFHTCRVTTGSKAFCWRFNFHGQLGNGTTTTSLVPVAVAGGHRFARIGLGSNHSCALTPQHEAWCWGFSHAQMGDDTGINRPEPVPVPHKALALATRGVWSLDVTARGSSVPELDSV